MLYNISLWKVKVLIAQLCLILFDPMDCSPPGSPVHGVLQARILEWVAIPFSWWSSWPSNQTWNSRITGRFFTVWATREAPYPRDIYFITGSLYFLTHFACIFHPPTPCSAAMGVVFVFGLDFTYKWDHMMFVFLWLISLSLTPSGSTHVKWQDFLLFLNDWIVFHCVHTNSHLLYPFIHGILHCFHLLALV